MRKIIIITGKVQNVNFRKFIRDNAKGLGLTGTVQNMDDKSVKVIVEGDDINSKKLINLCASGPKKAKPKSVVVSKEKETNEFENFVIIK